MFNEYTYAIYRICIFTYHSDSIFSVYILILPGWKTIKNYGSD